jgi:hypothetical protein
MNSLAQTQLKQKLKVHNTLIFLLWFFREILIFLVHLKRSWITRMVIWGTTEQNTSSRYSIGNYLIPVPALFRI